MEIKNISEESLGSMQDRIASEHERNCILEEEQEEDPLNEHYRSLDHNYF